MSKNSIPYNFLRFFQWFCRRELFEELQGDLEEAFEENKVKYSASKARAIYRIEIIKMIRPSVIRFGGQNSKFNQTIMLRNYYITAIRNLLKHKSYFAINISGLAIGIACFTFIALYIVNELSYDRFHDDYEDIYRISNHAIIRGEPNNSATTSAPVTKLMLENYPEVLKATRVVKDGAKLVGRGSNKINEEGIVFADPSIFNLFNFNLLKGNPETALLHPRSIVLTESYVTKYFAGEDPMGKQLTMEEDTIFYTVTGVVEDAPANSHIQFGMLASMSSTWYDETNRWVGSSVHAYVMLNDGAVIRDLEEKMRELFFYQYMAKEIEFFTGLSAAEWEGAGNQVNFKLIPITNIHLKSISTSELEPTGNIIYIYIYGLIGIVILFIAVFNFVNLATAHSAARAKEVGVRKVIGSTKRSLIYQFIFESIVVSTLATVLATIVVIGLMPSFSELINTELAYGIASSYLGPLALGGLALLVGILAGCYPAFVLSAFRPVDVLKGTLKSGLKSGWLRNALVTIQFAASIVIIIGTIAIYNQIDFMLSKNLGFDKEQILVIKRPDWLGENLEIYKNELLLNPNINTVANSKTIPGKFYDIRSYRRTEDAETFLFQNNQISYDHQELMGLELIEGRFFSKEYGLDSNAVVLNQTAAQALGFENPIGKTLRSAFKKGRPITIIGVVKDYNIESLHKSVAPVSLELDPAIDNYLSVKLTNAENIRETVQFIEEAWSQYSNDRPFQYFFFDEDYQQIYKSESTTGEILMVFSSLSVFIACLGLVGLITYSASIRKKEIGIRKILGASMGSVIKLLSGEIARLIVIATLVSWPLAYFATDYWLQDFADRVSISPWTYIISTMSLIVVVCFTISFQTIKACFSNPVDSLRQE